jgi:plastocyanin
MMPPRTPLVLLAALAVAAVAMTGTASGQREAHAAKTANVAVKDDFFSPSSLTVSKGTRVVWTWRGRNRHNVTVISGPREFASSTKRRGSYEQTLSRVGTYRIVCTIHNQRMKLVVRRPR